MKCIIVDDEPLARDGMKMLVNETPDLQLIGTFRNAEDAAAFLSTNEIDLIFLDIQMPGANGIEFARSLPRKSMIIFTTAFSDYALDSYDVDAIDYLVKPIELERYQRAIEKAKLYSSLLDEDKDWSNIEKITNDYVFIRSERKIFKVGFNEILYIQGLNNYVIIHTPDQKIFTAMNVKTIHAQLPPALFVRVSKSNIINILHIVSFDNNSVFVGKMEITIGNSYREIFFGEYVEKKLLGR